jgi:hypothetical protein
VIDPSEYRLEALHQDGEFILYRGLRQTKAETSPPSILGLSPVIEHPAPRKNRFEVRKFSSQSALNPLETLKE